MKILSLTSAIITGMLSLSILICGLWIHSHKITDPSSISFHMKLGTASVVSALITAGFLIIAVLKK